MSSMPKDQPSRDKNKVVAGVLGIVLPGLGLHHFYLGSINRDYYSRIQFLLPWVGQRFGTHRGHLAAGLSDEEFDAKYNAREPESLEFVFQKK